MSRNYAARLVCCERDRVAVNTRRRNVLSARSEPKPERITQARRRADRPATLEGLALGVGPGRQSVSRSRAISPSVRRIVFNPFFVERGANHLTDDNKPAPRRMASVRHLG
jgi:hypothetical protein